MRHVHLLPAREEGERDGVPQPTILYKDGATVVGVSSRWSTLDVATSAVMLLTFLNIVMLENMLPTGGFGGDTA